MTTRVQRAMLRDWNKAVRLFEEEHAAVRDSIRRGFPISLTECQTPGFATAQARCQAWGLAPPAYVAQGGPE